MGQTPSMLEAYMPESNFSHEEIERLRKRFTKFDTNNSGAIDRSEFFAVPAIASNPLASRFFAVVDADGEGSVDFNEFIRGLSPFSARGQDNLDERLRFAFDIYDIDRDGYISNGELFLVLKMMVGMNLLDWQLQQIVDKTIIQVDQDNDGKISFDEFKSFVLRTNVTHSVTLKEV